jgi:hypothetical protein
MYSAICWTWKIGSIQRHKLRTISCNISNSTMRTELYFKSAQFDQVRGKAEFGGFEKTYTNKSLLKVRWIHFDPVQGLDQYTSPGIQYYRMSKIKQYGCRLMGLFPNEQNFDLDKSRQTFHHSLKGESKLVIFRSFVAKCCKMRII